MLSTDFSEQISDRILCGERPRQTLHTILAHTCTNNTHHVPYCLKECPLLQKKPIYVMARTERVKKPRTNERIKLTIDAGSGNDWILIVQVM